MSGDDWKRDVKPLGDRAAKRPEPNPARGRAPDREPEFIAADGEGRRSDISRKQLSALRRGEWSVERDLDLHGFESAAARSQLLELLERAQSEGLRCVRVIHGRGLHSAETPVLRESLSDWLQRGKPARVVLAWAREARSRGGSTLILLRRHEVGPTERGR